MKTIRLTDEAMKILDDAAARHDVNALTYLNALIHYAGSINFRPGSWEATRPFDFSSYDDRTEEGRFADRWF